MACIDLDWHDDDDDDVDDKDDNDENNDNDNEFVTPKHAFNSGS